MHTAYLLIILAFTNISFLFSQEADPLHPTIKNPSAIYLYDHGKLYWNVQEQNIFTFFERNYRIHLLDTPATKELSRISVRYISKDDLEFLDKMEVYVAGKEETYSIADSAILNYSIDGIWTEKSINLSNLSPGDTINVSYIIRAKPSTDIQTWVYQQTYPVKKSTFSLMVPEFTACTDFIDMGAKIPYHKQIIDSTLTWGSYKIRSTLYSYELSDLKPVIDEPFAPKIYTQGAKHIFCFNAIRFSPDNYMFLPDWRTQCIELIDHPFWGKQFKSSANFKWLERETGDLLKQPFSDRLMADKLYTFVNESFRWNGSFGLFPEQSLREMQYSRYNNRSGLNMALLALCRSAKLKAYPVLFASKDRREVYPEISSVDQFDHMAVALLLGKDTFYMDAGDPELPPGLLHPEVIGKRGLFIRKYKIHWVRSEPGYAESNMLINLKMDHTALVGSLSVKMDGYDGYHERILISPDPRATHWKERMEQFHPSIRIDSIMFKNVEKVYQPLEITLYFHFHDISLPDNLDIVPGFYSFFSYNPFTADERNAPIVFPFQIAEDLVINYLIPDTMTASTFEPKRYKINDSVQMELYTSKTGPYHQFRYRVFIDQLHFDAGQYDALKVFFERVQDDLLTPIKYYPVTN